MNTALFFERLEPRIAPATLSPNARTVTFTDFDGDIVTVKTSKGTFDLAANFEFIGIFGLERLVRLDLEFSSEFSGANITITARRGPLGGDGYAAVGVIDATGTDLGTVFVDGDLGRMLAGDAETITPGLKKLVVQSIGEFGTSTQVSGNLQTFILGTLGSLVVKGNIREAIIDVFATGLVNGKIGSISIGGSLIGGAIADSGSIEASGAIGSIKIGGDILGGAGNISGRIHAVGKLGNVTVAGSVIGGDTPDTQSAGAINADGDLGFVKIGRHLRGGEGDDSGKITAGGKLAGIAVLGSVIGGSGQNNIVGFGQIYSGVAMGPVRIGGDLLGGSDTATGRIGSGGAIASVTISGAVLGGSGSSSASIFAGGNSILGPVKIGGNVIGGNGDSTAQIFGTGGVISVRIGGSVIGGGNSFDGHIGSGGNMGPVKIGGDLRGGNGASSGSISVPDSGHLVSVDIRGSMMGGTENSSGSINVPDGTVGVIRIGGDIVGGNAGTKVINSTGAILVTRLGSLFVGGSVSSGASQIASYENNGAIRASDTIGSILVKGSLRGNSLNPVIISAGGESGVAIKSVIVGGSIEFTRILAGYDITGSTFDGISGINADAQLGTVFVRGDWIASSILAGVDDNDPLDGSTGDSDDTKLNTTDNPALVSRIASITILGQALGTPNPVTSDHYGFVAQQIDSFTIGGSKFPLTAGPANDDLVVSTTADLRIREIPL